METNKRPDSMARINTPELAQAFIDEQVAALRAQVGDKKVLLALSGGVDSSVVAALLIRAIGRQLVCVHVNHGLMRKGESEQVVEVFRNQLGANLIYVDAVDRFLTRLEGVSDPEQKRKIIGAEFVRVFEEEARKLPHVRYLAQGTIYPDVIESGGGKGGKAATIKSHHNVGGLPKDVQFKLLEPLRLLFKDEVRQAGRELGLPDNMSFAGVVEPLRGLFKDEVRALGRQLGLPAAFVNRQPFPGPGLGVRVVGEITEEKLAILREADAIFRTEIVRRHIRADQYFAVLTDTRSVGVVGDFRTYGYTVALRAVRTSDFMTCVYVPISHTTLSAVATRIVNEVPGAGRVVYDITGKPPATVEWE